MESRAKWESGVFIWTIHFTCKLFNEHQNNNKLLLSIRPLCAVCICRSIKPMKIKLNTFMFGFISIFCFIRFAVLLFAAFQIHGIFSGRHAISRKAKTKQHAIYLTRNKHRLCDCIRFEINKNLIVSFYMFLWWRPWEWKVFKKCVKFFAGTVDQLEAQVRPWLLCMETVLCLALH